MAFRFTAAVRARAAAVRRFSSGPNMERYVTVEAHAKEIWRYLGGGITIASFTVAGNQYVMHERFLSFDRRFSSLESSLDGRFSSLDGRFSSLESSLDAKLEGLKMGVEGEISGVRGEIAGIKTQMATILMLLQAPTPKSK